MLIFIDILSKYVVLTVKYDQTFDLKMQESYHGLKRLWLSNYDLFLLD